MCAYVYICIYDYTHICIHAYIYNIYLSIYLCIYAYMNRKILEGHRVGVCVCVWEFGERFLNSIVSEKRLFLNPQVVFLS